MNNRFIVLSFLLLFSSISYAQFPITVNEIDLKSNGRTEYDGNLDDGRKIDDLSWASKSSVACFPGTQNKKFTGNHVLHGFVLPPYSEVTVTVEPHNRGANFSLYGYQVGTTSFPVVPKLSSCVSCEADHKWDYPKKNQTQDHTRTIKFNSIKNSYNVFIGVAGAEGLTKCDYTLKIDIKTREKNDKPQEKLKVYKAASEANATKVYKGNLKDGVKIHDLSWASSSSNACFPATQNKKFRGNHVLFVTDIPVYSEMEIELVPDDKNANMSIYGYMTGTTSSSMVPNLPSCISCEADHKWDYPKKNQTQDHTRSIRFNAIKNPYRIVIGIAGADGLADGGFIIKLKTKSRVMTSETQEKLKVYSAASKKGETKAYRGDLASGVKIHDLSWASSSSNACFPGTQNKKFRGNHVLYVTEIPPHSKMEITVVPEDKNANMSIYAYMTGTNSDAMVPKLSSCVTCEAEHKWDYPKKNKTQDHTRTVYLNAVNNPYRVVIGVAGADGLATGKFIVKIKTE